MIEWLTGKVVELHQENSRFYTLFIDAPSLEFKAGQFAFLGNYINEKMVSRPYSFVSAPNEKFLSFYFNTIENGCFSNHMASLQVGDSILVNPKVSGQMTLDKLPDAKDLWLFATGTGVGPYISILKTEEPWLRFKRIFLVYGVRCRNDLGFLNDIAFFEMNKGADFSVVYCTSREENEDTLHCRIERAFESGKLAEITGVDITPQHSQVLLCGNSGMIKSMVQLLDARGLTKNRPSAPGNITLEKYW